MEAKKEEIRAYIRTDFIKLFILAVIAGVSLFGVAALTIKVKAGLLLAGIYLAAWVIVFALVPRIYTRKKVDAIFRMFGADSVAGEFDASTSLMQDRVRVSDRFAFDTRCNIIPLADVSTVEIRTRTLKKYNFSSLAIRDRAGKKEVVCTLFAPVKPEDIDSFYEAVKNNNPNATLKNFNA